MNVLLDFILLGIVNSMVIIGFHLAVQFQYLDHPYLQRQSIRETRNILWFIKFWGDRSLNSFWRKPLYDCPRCMASIHSTYVYFPLVTFEHSILIYPVYVLFLSGLIEIITRKFEI